MVKIIHNSNSKTYDFFHIEKNGISSMTLPMYKIPQ